MSVDYGDITAITNLGQNHTMIRVKDNEKSLKFYQEVMGMTLMRTSENEAAKFNLYFLGYPGSKEVPKTTANGVNPIADREGLLELTWNYGTEKQEDFKYHNGNDEPQGFGHICTRPNLSCLWYYLLTVFQAFRLMILTQHASALMT
jgi:lactoylglutathione lyase